MSVKRRILIIDDETAFTRLLKMYLEEAGSYEVKTENDARESLRSAQEFRPDLILLDVLMPHLSGGDVAAQFKADPQLQRVPIVFLTAAVSKDEVTEHDQGFVGEHPLLLKPVSFKDVVACIERALQARS